MNISGISSLGAKNIVSVNPNQLETYTDSITLENLKKGDELRRGIDSAEKLRAYQAAVKASFERAVGGMPKPATVKTKIVRSFVTGNLVCENLLLETLPGYYATANVYKPLGAEGRLPAVLMVCGHSPEGRMNPVYQRVQRIIASAGFVVMGLDPIGQGERISYCEEGFEEPVIPPCTREHDYAGAQCLMAGIPITRYFVHDGVCALDYLAGRADVDAARIGLTGSSGGGTQTSMLMMAAPEKIAAAAPATFLSDRKAILYSRQAQDAEQIWPGMVKDGFDHADILACMAPKPVMVLAVDSDFFPLEGTHRSLEKARGLWKLFGKEDALELFTDASKHAYTLPLANAAADFFSRVLKGKPSAPVDGAETLGAEALFASDGGNVVKSLRSRIVHDFVLDELRAIDEANEKMPYTEKRKKAKEFVSTAADNFEPYPLYLKRSYSKSGNDTVYNLQTELLTWYQQEDIHNFGIFFKKAGAQPKTLTIALWDGGTTLLHSRLGEVMELCETGQSVFVVDLTGTGTVSDGLYNASQPDFYYTRAVTFCNNLLVNGDSLPAMRARGIRKAVDAALQYAGGDVEIRLLTHGSFNLYALMAKLIDGRIAGVTEKEPLESIRTLAGQKYYNHNNIMAIAMPGALRVFDIPELRQYALEKPE